jgi:hypothetical protein
VKSGRFIGLALQTSVAGTRRAWARIVLMVVGIGIAVSVLLGGLALDRAVNARKQREAARVPSGPGARGGQLADSTEMWSTQTPFRGKQILVVVVRRVGEGPLPPGLPRAPSVGEAFVSPDLAALMDGSSSRLLAGRLRAEPVGRIGSAGLVTPSELIAYVGPGDHPPVPGELYEGGSRQSFSMFRPTSLILLGIALMAFLLPVALFVVTATRLSAASRERRLAAIRLAGATEAQVRGLMAIEAAVVALAADGVGILMFLAGHWVAFRIPAVRNAWFAADVVPSLGVAAAVLALVPLAVSAVALAGSARIVVSPLGIVRPVRRSRHGGAWIWVGAFGLVLLGLDAWGRTWVVRQESPLPGILVGVPAVLLMLGLLGGTRWLSWLGSRALARWAPSPALLLGSRRLEADPGSSARVVTGVVLLVALVGVGQAIMAAQARDMSRVGSYLAPWSRTIPDSAIVATTWVPHPARQLDRLADVHGVSSVSLTHRYVTGGTSNRLANAVLLSDGTDATLERVRNALMWIGVADSMAFLRDRPSPDVVATNEVSRVVEAMALVLLLMTACSLLISTVDAVMERRRPLAILSAIGARTSTLRRTVLVQVAVPLVVGLGLGVAVSLVTTTLVFRIVSETLLLPIGSLVELAAVAALLVLLVTAGTLPWVRTATRAEGLRTE